MSTRKSTATTASQPQAPANRASVKPSSARQSPASTKAGGSRISRTAQAITRQVSDNPFVTLAGAAAVTAGIAMLLPASRREGEVMGDLAGKIGDAARELADSAVETGREQVTELAQAALGSVGGNMVESLIGAPAGAAGQSEAN